MATTTQEIIQNLGPLAALAGTWSGTKGTDVAPSDDVREVPARSAYREQMTFVPFGPVDNHQQRLWGLRYQTTAWRVDAEDSFHEEVGYWLWDPTARQVMRCFLVPRGMTVLAGGTVDAGAREWALTAEVGSPTYGICSNPFLNTEFRTVRYDLKITIHDDKSFSYDEDTVILMKGASSLFHHTDKNTLTRIG